MRHQSLVTVCVFSELDFSWSLQGHCSE